MFFNILSTVTLKNVFFVIFRHTSSFMMIKISREVEESIGRKVLFLKILPKNHKFAWIRKNMPYFLECLFWFTVWKPLELIIAQTSTVFMMVRVTFWRSRNNRSGISWNKPWITKHYAYEEVKNNRKNERICNENANR